MILFGSCQISLLSAGPHRPNVNMYVGTLLCEKKALTSSSTREPAERKPWEEWQRNSKPAAEIIQIIISPSATWCSNQDARHAKWVVIEYFICKWKSNNSEVVKIYIFSLVIFTWIVFIKQMDERILFYKTKEEPLLRNRTYRKKRVMFPFSNAALSETANHTDPTQAGDEHSTRKSAKYMDDQFKPRGPKESLIKLSVNIFTVVDFYSFFCLFVLFLSRYSYVTSKQSIPICLLNLLWHAGTFAFLPEDNYSLVHLLFHE